MLWGPAPGPARVSTTTGPGLRPAVPASSTAHPSVVRSPWPAHRRHRLRSAHSLQQGGQRLHGRAHGAQRAREAHEAQLGAHGEQPGAHSLELQCTLDHLFDARLGERRQLVRFRLQPAHPPGPPRRRPNWAARAVLRGGGGRCKHRCQWVATGDGAGGL